jgi:D-methionine transport system substrate-binding protein
MMSVRLLLLSAAIAASVVIPATAETIKVGVTAGPHAQIFEVVKSVAARNGLDVEIVEFKDYAAPNVALNAGELQANSFRTSLIWTIRRPSAATRSKSWRKP